MSREAYRFLCDENVNHRVVEALRQRGIDVTHILDLGMLSAPDDEVIARALKEDRIILTRDYSDFGKHVVMQHSDGMGSPGVLFISPSIPEGDPGALLRAIERWIQEAEPSGRSVRNIADWLTLTKDDPGFGRRVREATTPYLTALERVS